MSSVNLSANKVAPTLSYVLSIFGTLVFLLPVQNDTHYLTPFTSNPFIVFIYWFVTLLAQFLFIAKTFYNAELSENSQAEVIKIIGPHFTFFNILHFFWCWFFKKEMFLISEGLLITNLLNLLLLYFHHKTSSIRNILDWLTVHLPLVGFPFSWILFAIFWNGACLFHSHNKHLMARILANIFIWDFLFVPLAFIVFHKDWSIALSTSLLMLGVGLSQMFTRVVAIQWIFAFTISAVNFAISIITIISSSLSQNDTIASQNQQTPLIA